MSSLEYQDLCRLCLVKDDVSVPIFEDVGDIHQICNKITTCLPVKVTKEDKLPQKLCNNCVYKVESFYQFWHQTLNVEKQLLQWLENAEKQGYSVGTVFNQSGMKDQSNENRLVGNVMQQVSIHQSNMNMDMDNMGVCMPMMMTGNNQQQITSVPMDTSGSSIQNIQAITGSNTQATHDQITQTQTNTSTQQEEEDESSEDEENSDDECDGDDGLPIKEESEEDPNNSRTIEPTTFVNVSLACEDPGPSGLQQQKMADIQEMAQATDVDPKTGIIEVRMLTGRAGGSNEEERGEKDPRAQSTFDSNAMMEDPLRIAEKEKEQEVYQCSVCQMFFTRKSDLKRHMVCHSDARPYKCTVCEKSFKRSYALASHARLHSGVRHKCDSCDFTTMNKLSLKLHHRRLHQRDFRYQCERCDKCFMSNYELTDHQASHLGARTFACGHCSKAYSQKSHLVAHERLSHGVRRAKSRHFCDLCSKGFISEEALRKHTNRHVMCVQCSKEFPSNHALTQHIRKNSCERPYQCKLCPKAFGKAGMLKVHELLIHENDVPATSADAASRDTAA